MQRVRESDIFFWSAFVEKIGHGQRDLSELLSEVVCVVYFIQSVFGEKWGARVKVTLLGMVLRTQTSEQIPAASKKLVPLAQTKSLNISMIINKVIVALRLQFCFTHYICSYVDKFLK